MDMSLSKFWGIVKDREAWRAAVHGVAKSRQTQLSGFAFTFPYKCCHHHAETEAPVLWPLDVNSWLTGKDPDARKDWGQEEKGTTEDEMVGGHHKLKRHESEQIPGDSEGQGSLACCSLWGSKESDMTEQLSRTEWIILGFSFLAALGLLCCMWALLQLADGELTALWGWDARRKGCANSLNKN